MDATTLSPARLDLWRALDQFEDEVRYLLCGGIYFGRSPAPWRDPGIRAAATAVAREEDLTEEDVIRGLLADAYGFDGDVRSLSFFSYGHIRRVADALPRQLEPMEPTDLRDIAAMQAAVGNIVDARASARSIEDAFWRAGTLGDIAATQAAAGDIEGALASARNIEDVDIRSRALSDLATTQAAAGDIDGAVALARSIEDADACAEALRNVAATQDRGLRGSQARNGA